MAPSGRAAALPGRRPACEPPLLLTLLTASLVASVGRGADAMVPLADRAPVAEQVEDMYDHAFGSYMRHAFPDDELRPLSCDGRRHKERGDLDAVLGNYSLTLIDALDSLVIFGRTSDFQAAVQHVCDNVDFDMDVEVSTFEVNIRVLGGLLSGHMHATELFSDEYDGGLLSKAVDLSQRLLVAFSTPTGMPLSRINLRHGRPQKVSTSVTIAEAGSFLLEFGVLTLLTGNETWYTVAKQSILAFWGKRSTLDLVGSLIDVNTGALKDQQGTVGPGQDSFFEYLLKGYVLFDDTELLDMFLAAYAAVEEHINFEGFQYTVDIYKGLMSNAHLSPLAAVWGSLQVLIGDVAGGLRTVLYWYSLWAKHGALPEVFDTKTEAPTSARDSPLRPELIEAMFYLSLALPDDPDIFRMAKSMVEALDSQSRVDCGFASVADVTTKRLDDRMDSFFVSETLVYLYLTALSPSERQVASPWPLSSVVFSTEGHMFPVPVGKVGLYVLNKMPLSQSRSANLYPELSRRPMGTCEALSPFERAAVQARCRTKYLLTSAFQIESKGPSAGQCRPQQVVLIIRSKDDEGASKVLMALNGIASSFGPPLAAMSPEAEEELLASGGLEAAVTRESAGNDGEGSCGADASGALAEVDGPISGRWWPEDQLGLSRLELDRAAGSPPSFSMARVRHAPARAVFATRTLVAAEPLDACSSLRAPRSDGGSSRTEREVQEYYEGRIVIVARGACLFLQKLQRLQRSRAAGAIVVNQAASAEKEELLVMTCPLQERGAGRDVHVPGVMISSTDGATLLDLLKGREMGEITVGIFTRH